MKPPAKNRSTKRQPTGWRWTTGAWIAAFAAAGALQISFHQQSREIGYEIGSIRDIAAHLGQESRELEIELATLTSPPEVDRLARLRLGMREPADGQVVKVP